MTTWYDISAGEFPPDDRNQKIIRWHVVHNCFITLYSARHPILSSGADREQMPPDRSSVYWMEATKSTVWPEQAFSPLWAFQDIKFDMGSMPSPVPESPDERSLISACLSVNHGFGLMDESDKSEMMRDAKEWWKAIAREINEPSKHPIVDQLSTIKSTK